MPHPRLSRGIVLTFFLAMVVTGCRPSPAPTAPTADPGRHSHLHDIPYPLISSERMLAHLEVLTNIQAYSGFRTAGTTGEAEAFDYVAAQLERMDNLKEMGLEIERQSFDVFVTTEIHQAQLFLTVAGGQEAEVPASGLRGSRYRPGCRLLRQRWPPRGPAERSHDGGRRAAPSSIPCCSC